MTKQALRLWQHRFHNFLTLRRRLMLWTASLLLVLGLGLTIYINAMTAIRVPQAVSEVVAVQLIPTQNPRGESLHPVSSPIPSLPQSMSLSVAGEEIAIARVQEIAIREVRIVSLIGTGIFAVMGAMGAYWIARQALRPVQRLSHLVQEIRVEALDRRLALDGPPDEVKELADAFDRLLERLERSFEQQSRFVSDAAHELRTPLASLRTNVEMVLSNPDTTLADYREMASALERALERLERLVNDLLLLARGEKDIRIEPLYLEVLIGDVLLELKPLAQSHQVSLHWNIPDEVVVQADAPLLTRAVSNLIQNGIRYNHPGGSVTVTVHREANGVIISVEDTGIGIAPEEKSRVFERFYRGDITRARHRGGSGLGLSIAAHIVQLHGGHIQVESTPGVGSIFTVWLPERAPWTRNLTVI
ncbi:MAG: HAMP domain-containing histidine kinase [Anaerolineae bacterium]|nr:HAMP domain-containing histidine kinase [Anaerolineae bacterium]